MFRVGENVKATLPNGTVIIGKLAKNDYDPDILMCIKFSDTSKDHVNVLFMGSPMYGFKIERVVMDEPQTYGSTIYFVDNLGREVRFVKWVADDSKQWVSDMGAMFSWTMLAELIADGTYTLVDYHVA